MYVNNKKKKKIVDTNSAIFLIACCMMLMRSYTMKDQLTANDLIILRSQVWTDDPGSCFKYQRRKALQLAGQTALEPALYPPSIVVKLLCFYLEMWDRVWYLLQENNFRVEKHTFIVLYKWIDVQWILT